MSLKMNAKIKKDTKELLSFNYENSKYKYVSRINKNLQNRAKVEEVKLEKEYQRRVEQLKKEHNKIVKENGAIRRSRTVPSYAVSHMQRRRRELMNDVCEYLAQCYINRQHDNKSQYFNMLRNGELAGDHPVKKMDHLRFVQETFPKICGHSAETESLGEFKKKLMGKRSIFDGHSLSHRMKCPESQYTRSLGEEVEVFPVKKAVDFRYWRPKPEDLGYSASELWEIENSDQGQYINDYEIGDNTSSSAVDHLPDLSQIQVSHSGSLKDQGKSVSGHSLLSIASKFK